MDRKYLPESTCRVYELTIGDMYKTLLAEPWRRVLDMSSTEMLVSNTRGSGRQINAYPWTIGCKSKQIVYCKKSI